MKLQIQSLLDKELAQDTGNIRVFKNEQCFSLDFVPEKLVHRSGQLKEMMHYFKAIFKASEPWLSFSQTVVLSGGNGTGKTAVAKRFGMEIEQLAIKKLSWINFRYRHMNCRRNRTVYSVLVTLMKSLIPDFPSRGFASAELIRMLQNLLDQTNSYLLLTLDEIDFLLVDPNFSNFLYSLSRLHDDVLQQSHRRISLILITKSSGIFSHLDQSVQSTLSKNYIMFPAYTSDQLKDIVRIRAFEGLNHDTINEEVLEYIAFSVGSSGDSRYALELLWRAAKKAESQKAPKILLEHVKSSTMSILPIKPSILTDLSLPQKVLLLSIIRCLEKKKTTDYVTLPQIKALYILECNDRKLKIGRGNTSIWNHLQILKELKIIRSEIVSKNFRGRFSKISLEEKLPLENIVQELEIYFKKYALQNSL